MATFLPNSTYERLISDLTGAFMAAATNPLTELREKLAEALATADVLPESCRSDIEG